MPKKHRVSHNTTMKSHSFAEHTLCGIHQWYESMFEKLGWMLLANRNGWIDKILTYKNSIQRLQNAIEHRWKEVKDIDSKTDLHIMLENVKCLKEHVNKDFF
jgi:hypothetical protein